MKLKYFLFYILLFTVSTFVNANDDPCPNPQDSGFLEIPSIAGNPHNVEVLAFGNCGEANGECQLSEFNVKTRSLSGGGNNPWLSDTTSNTGQGGSNTIFDTDISWTSEMNNGALIITVTATNDGVVVDETTLMLECKDNRDKGCCDLPPSGCAGSMTEYACDNIGGIFWLTAICSPGDANRRPSCKELPPLASGSGEEGGGMGAGKSSNVEETNEDSEVQAKQLALDYHYNASYKSIRLNVQVPKSNLMNIQIYNLSGQVIYQQSSYALKGSYSKSIQLSNNISTGIYFINIRLGNRQITKKIMIAQ